MGRYLALSGSVPHIVGIVGLAMMLFAIGVVMSATVLSLRAERDTLAAGMQVERSNRFAPEAHTKELLMNRLIYIIGAIVVIVAVLSFFGLR